MASKSVIGFTPNEVPLSQTNGDDTGDDGDASFRQIWDKKLELTSTEVVDAYARYTRFFRR